MPLSSEQMTLIDASNGSPIFALPATAHAGVPLHARSHAGSLPQFSERPAGASLNTSSPPPQFPIERTATVVGLDVSSVEELIRLLRTAHVPSDGGTVVMDGFDSGGADAGTTT
jgi:hypothetical protein